MSHQARRAPLPTDYQYEPWRTLAYAIALAKRRTDTAWEARLKACPTCGGPSVRGGLCYGCTADPLEPSADNLWGV